MAKLEPGNGSTETGFRRLHEYFLINTVVINVLYFNEALVMIVVSVSYTSISVQPYEKNNLDELSPFSTVCDVNVQVTFKYSPTNKYGSLWSSSTNN